MAVGRKTVAPRQTITSQWGNWVWDQSIQTFSDRAARNTQFPAPHVGACCSLDSRPGLLFLWNGSAWFTRQEGEAQVTTNASGGFSLTYPMPFTAIPADIQLTGAGDAVWFVNVNVHRANLTPTQLWGVARQADGSAWVNTVIDIYWAAFGPD